VCCLEKRLLERDSGKEGGEPVVRKSNADEARSEVVSGEDDCISFCCTYRKRMCTAIQPSSGHFTFYKSRVANGNP
jgi:hypothetical protein